MRTEQILESEEVQALRDKAEFFTASFRAQHPSLGGPEFDFKLIVEASRQALPIRSVQALYSLSFPLPNSADEQGMRFLLWKPVLEFLQKSFHVEIEEWLCRGEVALAYLTNDSAIFAQRITGPLEESRRSMPFRSEYSGYGVILNSLCELEVQLRYEDPTSADIIRQIRQKDRHSSRVKDRLRQELTRLTEDAPDWIVQLCIDFLTQHLSGRDEEYQGIEIASQESLATDWLSDEEEQAWHDL